MIDNLTLEILKRIVANIGAAPGEFGRRGLADASLALQKTLTVKYENSLEVQHDIHSGSLQLDNHKLRGLLINLSIEDYYEFLFVFRMGDLPIHAIRVAWGNPEDSFIRVYHTERDKWIIPSMYLKARLLADFEQFVSLGVLWDECKEIRDLYDIAVVLVNDG